MSDPMRVRSTPLRLMTLRLNLDELPLVARQPGIVEAFRLTIRYHDARHPDQVATIIRRQREEVARMTVIYQRVSAEPITLDLTLPAESFARFSLGLRRLGFDRLDDAPDMPWHGADLWLFERAAGTFHHDLLLSPEHVTGVHMELVALLREWLPKALRPDQTSGSGS